MCDVCGRFEPAAGVGRYTVSTPDGRAEADLCRDDGAELLKFLAAHPAKGRGSIKVYDLDEIPKRAPAKKTTRRTG